jgi:glycosyltransferase involved in cell wall biosynthesis
MPTVLIEACAAGKPIVTTEAIGCKECVEEGLNGYKVPVKSVVELANAMEKLINSPSDRKRMGHILGKS